MIEIHHFILIVLIGLVAWFWWVRDIKKTENELFTEKVIELESQGKWVDLGEMHLKGIPNKGIKPNHTLAIVALQKAASTSPKAAFMLANILEDGFVDFKPDIEVACTWYSYILKTWPNEPTYYKLSVTKLKHLTPAPKPKIVNVELFVPDPKLNLNVIHAPKIKILSHRERRKQDERDQRRALKRLGEIQQSHFWLSSARIKPVDVKKQSIDFDRATNDSQNIHNTSVASTVANSIQKLKETTHLSLSTSEVLRQVRSIIKPHTSQVLDAIETDWIVIDRIGLTEVQVLELVYNRIMSDKFDDETRKTLLDNLTQAFEDSVEDGRPVCVGGRIARLVDVLNVLDTDVTIKPAWAVRDEMLSKASKIRDALYDALSTEDKIKVDGAGPEADQFQENLKSQIQSQMHADYVETGILTENRLNIELEEWIDHV
jgi:hypothetical protein